MNMLLHSWMTGTGFIGYLGVGGEYFTVLVTNNHVIQTLDDAKSSRLKFESAFGKGQHCTVKLCDAIADEPNNFWTSSVNEVCGCVRVSVSVCVRECSIVLVCVCCACQGAYMGVGMAINRFCLLITIFSLSIIKILTTSNNRER